MLIILACIAVVIAILIILVVRHGMTPLTDEENAMIDQEAESVRRSSRER